MRSEADIPLNLRAYEKACLERALSQARGDVRAVPALLGDHPSPIYRKLAAHGLGGVYLCEHGRARLGAGAPAHLFDHEAGPYLEVCAACVTGMKIPMENRYR